MKTFFECVVIFNFEHISHLVLVYLLLTLNMQSPAAWKACLDLFRPLHLPLLHDHLLTVSFLGRDFEGSL